MRLKHVLHMSCAIVALTVSHSGFAQTNGGGAIEEVVVTAEKREEHDIDVPVAVNVLPAEALVETGEVRFRDYYTSIPGFTLGPGPFGQEGLGLRGVSTATSNPTVGIVIDDIPYGGSTLDTGSQFVPELDPGDLKSIEVLRGPQGTLYGANSMGGLLKFVTVDPSTDGFFGRVEAGISSVYNGAEPGYSFRASANVPFTDTLAIRVSGFDRQDPGYIDNPFLNIEGVNKGEAYGGRFSGLWQPSADLSLKISALYQNLRSHGLSEDTVGPGLGDLQQNYIPGAGKSQFELQAYSAILKYRLGDVDFVSLTGYNANINPKTIDYSFTAFGTLIQQNFGVTGALFYFDNNIRRFTQEVRASGTLLDNVDWLVGVFYSHETDRRDFPIYAENATTGQIVGLDFNFYYPGNQPSFEESAVFADLTYHFSDRFDIQLGGRESFDRLALPITVEPFAGFPTTIAPAESSSSQTFTYLATPRYKLSQDMMLYTRFASGYRPGSPNEAIQGIPDQSRPDSVESYEAGFKGEFLDHSFSLDAALYYINWQNIQIELDTKNGFAYVANGGSAKSEGVEISIESHPLDGLTIDASATYDDAVLTEAFPASSTAVGVVGDKLPNTSPFAGHISINQDFPLWGESEGYVGAAVSYVGNSYSIFLATPQRQLFPAFTKTDLRAGVRCGAWSFSAYANNVADVRGVVGGGLGYTPPSAFVYIQPRTIGFTLSRTF